MEIDNDKVVSTHELNKVLTSSLQESQTIIDIQFKNPIKKINIVFIAGLILYHRQYRVTYRITYPKYFDRIFEVRHYLKQFEKIFNQNWTNVFDSFQGIRQLSDGDYVSSESFAPILFIDENSIDNIFEKKVSSDNRNGLFVLKQKYIDIKLSDITNEIYLAYKNELKKDLQKESPIYSFVYMILLKKIKPFKGVKKGGSEEIVNEAIQKAKDLKEFTKEYITGLKELAKNIVEHTESGEGMITIRAYDDEETKNTSNQNKILETHVFDFGAKGVIPKLIEDTKAKKAESELFLEDLEVLSGDFAMRDFIKPTIETTLNQQKLRDLAHYGLMKFYD